MSVEEWHHRQVSRADPLAYSPEGTRERHAWGLGDLSESSRWALYLLLPSSSTKIVDDPRVQQNPYYQAAIDTLEFGGPAPAFAGSSNWGLTVLLPNFQRVLLGEIMAEEAVDNMMKSLDKAVKG